MKNHLPTHPAAVLALAFLATIVLGTALLMLPWATASGESAPWLTALFTSVTARTAGFNAVDIGALELESLVLHCELMFIGGGSAGTAGGVKVTTVFLLLLIVWSEIRGQADVVLRGRRIGTQVLRQALSILVLSGAAVSLGLLVINQVPRAYRYPEEKPMVG